MCSGLSCLWPSTGQRGAPDRRRPPCSASRRTSRRRSPPKLFHVPTWAALGAGGVDKFGPPADIQRLVVFGDNDEHGVGQKAAYVGVPPRRVSEANGASDGNTFEEIAAASRAAVRGLARGDARHASGTLAMERALDAFA